LKKDTLPAKATKVSFASAIQSHLFSAVLFVMPIKRISYTIKIDNELCFTFIEFLLFVFFLIGCLMFLFLSSFVERVGSICWSCVESKSSEESSNSLVGKRVRYSFFLFQLFVVLVFDDLHGILDTEK